MKARKSGGDFCNQATFWKQQSQRIFARPDEAGNPRLVFPHEEPVYGLRAAEVMGNGEDSVVKVTKRYREQGVPGMNEWLVISRDHAGNPVGLSRDGGIYLWDHDFCETVKLADTSEEYLTRWCLKLEK